jgi:hypothetical protein
LSILPPVYSQKGNANRYRARCFRRLGVVFRRLGVVQHGNICACTDRRCYLPAGEVRSLGMVSVMELPSGTRVMRLQADDPDAAARILGRIVVFLDRAWFFGYDAPQPVGENESYDDN